MVAKQQYVWGDRYVDDLVLRDRDTDGGTPGLEERLYAMQDPNWNVVAVAEADGDVQERYTYSAYGVPSVLTPAFADRGSTSFAWDQLYTGRSQDAETGLYYYRNRYYSPDLGRFLTRDPIAYEAKEFNLYRYVGNRPMTDADASGLTGMCYTRVKFLRLERVPGSHLWSPWWSKWRCVYRKEITADYCKCDERCPINTAPFYENVIPTPIPGLLLCWGDSLIPVVEACVKK